MKHQIALIILGLLPDEYSQFGPSSGKFPMSPQEAQAYISTREAGCEFDFTELNKEKAEFDLQIFTKANESILLNYWDINNLYVVRRAKMAGGMSIPRGIFRLE